MGFKEAKRRVLKALISGDFVHAVRDRIDEKNLLHAGDVTTEEIIEIVKNSNGNDHNETPHHTVPSTTTHVLKREGWYIKFYFVDRETTFISVHKRGLAK